MPRLTLFTLLALGGVACSSSAQLAPDPSPASEPLDRPATLVSATVPLTAAAVYADGGPVTRFFDYGATIDRVTNMVNDDGLVSRAGRRGLDVLDLTWEDTGRAMGSSIGPNISDLTLQVRRQSPFPGGGWVTSLMPVLRFPNFSDRTGDVPADRFFARVGNEKDSGNELKTIPLTELLRNLKEYVSAPSSIKGSGNMLAARDTHFLVSAQAVFLPIPKRGKAEFSPVLFNYQSAPGSPADLAILVSRQGTSVQVIENKPEEASGAGWGQELYFNAFGQRAALTAERRSDVALRIAEQGGPLTEDDKTSLQKGADVLFLIQVPLRHKSSPRAALPGLGYGDGFGGGGVAKMAAPSATAAPQESSESRSARPDVEQAVLGHGPSLGPFHEGHDLELVRDPTFPIRITVQFYKATSNGVVDDEDLDLIRKNIEAVYKHADFVGSLVVPEGDALRPTAWQKVPGEWFPW
ncbi:MAG TPA: hypothetical protein VLM85_08170 [Polyangiaceae bacterium]|nr:hypothetical protein [Polyangiaceae bacterium]